MKKEQFDSFDERLKRYNKALEHRKLKLFMLEEAYRFSLPGRNKWLIETPGFYRENQRWDPTAVEALKSFSSNVVSLLMPPFTRWMELTSGPDMDDSAKKIMDEKLQFHTLEVFNAINSSNLSMQSDISFQDTGISVGLLQIKRTGDKRNPVEFEAIPLHNVAIESFKGEIKDVWREIKVPARDIQAIWPKAKLSGRIQQILSTSPGENVKLVEGTIYYPNNPPHSRYLYYLADQDAKFDLIWEPTDFSPWIPYRFSVSPGEVWGDGPVMQILDWIKIVNTMTEFEIKNAGLKTSPPLAIKASEILNTDTLRIEPGSVIRVQDVTNPPIVPLNLAGDIRFTQLSLEQMQEKIREVLFADPIGPGDQPGKTATEISVLQQNWVKKSAASFGRLNNELLRPIIEKTIYLMRKDGFLKDLTIDETTYEIKLDGSTIDVEFKSPIAKIQDTEDAQNFTNYFMTLTQMYGPQAAAGMVNSEDVAQYMGEKMDIPLKLVKDGATIVQQLQQASQAAQQPPMQNALPAPSPTGDQIPANPEGQMPQQLMGVMG